MFREQVGGIRVLFVTRPSGVVQFRIPASFRSELRGLDFNVGLVESRWIMMDPSWHGFRKLWGARAECGCPPGPFARVYFVLRPLGWLASVVFVIAACSAATHESSCTDDAQCDPGFVCEASTCSPRRIVENRTTCTTSLECNQIARDAGTAPAVCRDSHCVPIATTTCSRIAGSFEDPNVIVLGSITSLDDPHDPYALERRRLRRLPRARLRARGLFQRGPQPDR